MLSRAALPLLRPRTLQATSRLALLQCQTRGIRDQRHRLNIKEDYEPPTSAQPYSSQREPLRPVPKSDAERIDPQQRQSIEESEPVTESSHPSQPLPDLRNGIPSDYDTDAQPQRPQQPLPDLTRGIPSTIEAELDQASKRHASRDSLNITEDPDSPQDAAAGGGRSDDGLPRNAYISSSDRKRNRLIQVFYATFGLGGIAYLLYMGRNWADEEEKAAHPDVLNGYTPGLMYARAMARFGSTMSYYKDPVVPKLLPDPEVYPEGQGPPPFTLVLSLEDMLVHSEWSREHGWRVAKRPGLDYFLKYLSQYYELVMFTSQPAFAIEQMLRKMDPYQLMYPLFREHTAYEDGVHVKDLSYLNRKLDKVLIIDTDAKHVLKQPENAIILPKWTGDPNDKTLVEFIPFLEYLANMGFQDTREVLKSFEGKYIPAEFDRRQKLLREKFQAQQGEKKRPKHSLGGLSSFFGTKPQTADGQQTISQAEAEGKMIWDQIRERGQQNYMALEKRIQEEGEKWLAEQKAAEAKMQEEAMNNFKSGMFGWFGGSKKPEESK